MSTIVAIVGLLIGALGIVGLVRPRDLVTLVQRVTDDRAGLRGAIAFRVVFGLVLLSVAEASRAPLVLWVIGLVSIASAAIGVAMGEVRLRAFVRWWTGLPLSVVRAWGVIALGFGVLFVWAVV